MSDETVRVPAAPVEALREALGHRKAADFSARFHRESLFTAARALVDAAERPDEDNHGGRGWEATETGWRCTECHHEVIGPVDVYIDAAHRCTPALSPSPRRTRDEGSEDEAEASWDKFRRNCYLDPAIDTPATRRAWIAGYRARAARLAGEDDR